MTHADDGRLKKCAIGNGGTAIRSRPSHLDVSPLAGAFVRQSPLRSGPLSPA